MELAGHHLIEWPGIQSEAKTSPSKTKLQSYIFKKKSSFFLLPLYTLHFSFCLCFVSEEILNIVCLCF